MQNGNLTYGCLVRVGDINRVRAFYRDTLELGDPIVDSNFWLEFKLPGAGILAIEQSNSALTNENRQDVSVLLQVDDIDTVVKKMKSKAVLPMLPAREIPGRTTVTVRDPEGNLITFYSHVSDSAKTPAATIEMSD